MTCENYSEWISLYIDEALDQPARAEFENHINNCPLCLEEVQFLRQMTADIKTLEMLDLPEEFHQTLMGKIKTVSGQSPQKPVPIAKHPWYRTLTMASALAAVFIFSVILINPPKTNKQSDLVAEQKESVMESRMMGPAEDNSQGQATESSDGQSVEPLARLRNEPVPEISSFSLEPVEPSQEELWQITSQDYDGTKEAIIGIVEALDLELASLEEAGSKELETQTATLQIILSPNEKQQLKAALKEFDQTIYLPDSSQDKEQEKTQLVQLIIMINQIHK